MGEMLEPNNEIQKRQIAFKASVEELKGGHYVKRDGWEPNVVLTNRGREISRANVMGIVVGYDNSETSNSVNIDDGTGNMSVRSFNEPNVLTGLTIGDAVNIVGRPREFGSNIYLIAEVARKIDDKTWLEVRRMELDMLPKPVAVQEPAIENPSMQTVAEEVVVTETIAPEPSGQDSKVTAVYNLIKELDKGDGADHEEIISKAEVDNADAVISNLLVEGEIFECSPGKLKILE